MEAIEKAKNAWKGNTNNLKKPSVLVAYYKDTVYYVIRDDSFIVFFIPYNSDITYALPKKYFKIEKSNSGKYYDILDISNVSVVSCIGSKNDLELFVIKNLIEK